VASSPRLRLVDAGDVPALGAKLLAWNLESSGSTRLVGAVEFEVTGTDRVIHTQIVRVSEFAERPCMRSPGEGPS